MCYWHNFHFKYYFYFFIWGKVKVLCISYWNIDLNYHQPRLFYNMKHQKFCLLFLLFLGRTWLPLHCTFWSLVTFLSLNVLSLTPISGTSHFPLFFCLVSIHSAFNYQLIAHKFLSFMALSADWITDPLFSSVIFNTLD